jgi:N-glycosylase/DNA lyase
MSLIIIAYQQRIGQQFMFTLRASIGHIDDQAISRFPFHQKALTGPGIESHLRELGFGYRAGYIAKTASIVANEKPEGWLQTLCNEEPYDDSPDQKPLPEGGREGYRRAHEELLQLQGVGPKVADCVCLMGLGWGEAVPVDTHVWQIAQRDYKFGKGNIRASRKLRTMLLEITSDSCGVKRRAGLTLSFLLQT